MELNSVKSFLFGLTIGDALGVPVEYKSRDFLTKNPVTGFIGNGTHNQPAGSFSESSSLSLCLVENIVEDYNITSLLSRIDCSLPRIIQILPGTLDWLISKFSKSQLF